MRLGRFLCFDEMRVVKGAKEVTVAIEGGEHRSSEGDDYEVA